MKGVLITRELTRVSEGLCQELGAEAKSVVLVYVTAVKKVRHGGKRVERKISTGFLLSSRRGKPHGAVRAGFLLVILDLRARGRASASSPEQDVVS